jgi:hypothetical protein
MNKIFTIEIDEQGELVEMHLNKEGAEYLRDILNRVIEVNSDDHLHLMTPDWGGNELTEEKQNQSDTVKLIHQLKLMYWK